MTDVVAFTDAYLPTINGVSYTLSTWAERWTQRRDRMEVVYPNAKAYTPRTWEHPVASVPFPFYEGYRMAPPWIPRSVSAPDVVHIHSVFTLGIAGLFLARKCNLPLVATYHTPMKKYARYVAPGSRTTDLLKAVLERYERVVLERADVVTAPSRVTKSFLRDELGVTNRVAVVSNGINLELFSPVEANEFREHHQLSGPVIGYTGRHGVEKNIEAIFAATDQIEQDVTVAIGGDGPHHEKLRKASERYDVDIRFLRFLPRDQLPEFYSAIDIFAFPSPVETEGIVAMEAIACGTPVVGVNAGALPETITAGETGYLYEQGDISSFAATLETALSTRSDLRDSCLRHREVLGVKRTLDKLAELYADIQ